MVDSAEDRPDQAVLLLAAALEEDHLGRPALLEGAPQAPVNWKECNNRSFLSSEEKKSLRAPI
jgi:hypothetical protein